MINFRPEPKRQSSFRGSYAAHFLAMLMICLMAGCSNGPKTKKAGGILKVNGKPVTGTTGTIEFYPVGGGRTANAVVKDDGTFTISYRKPGDGLPPGKYKVAVIADIYTARTGKKIEEPADDGGFMENPGTLKHVVPVKYNSIERTPLEYEIPDDGEVQHIEIDIIVKK